jgi:hypothetical protein
MDHKHMKAIDADYCVKVGYWASRNNMQEYKIYVTMIQFFDSDFVNNLWQTHGDNLWLAESINHNYKTCLLCRVEFLLGKNKAYQYSLVEMLNKKWPKNESDPEDNEYELPI